MNISYPCKLHILDSVDSTNNYARNLHDFNVPQVIIAKEQTDGKGTKGRSFYSEKGKGLYMSISYIPKDYSLGGINNQLAFTSEIGKTVASVLSKYSKEVPCTKPINDVYINGKKVAGILTETDSFGIGKFSKVIIGIGINLFKQDFPDEIKETAGYIENPAIDFEIDDVANDIVNRIFKEYIKEYIVK